MTSTCEVYGQIDLNSPSMCEGAERLPDRTDAQPAGPVDEVAGAGLGEPVPLHECQAGGREEERDLPGQRGGAGAQDPDPPTQPVAQLGEDQPVGDAALQSEPGRYRLAV